MPYNGSMASLQFGPVSAARVRRWLREGHFDVVHVHEPAPPSVSLLVCMIADGPDRRHLPRRDHPVEVAGRLGPGRPALAGADQRPDRRLRLRPPRAGRAPRRRRRDHPERRARRRLRRRADAARLHPRRRRPDDRLPRPLRRAAQGPAGAARGDAHRRPRAPRARGCSSPAAATPTSCGSSIGEDLRAARRAARRAVRGRQGARSCGRSTSTARRTCWGSPSASSSSRHWPPARRSSPATWTPSPGCSRTARPACSSAAATPAALAGALRRPARRPGPAGASCPRAGARAAAAYDWQVLARRILAVYETVVPPGGGAVDGGTTTTSFPAVPRRGGSGRDVLRRWVAALA